MNTNYEVYNRIVVELLLYRRQEKQQQQLSLHMFALSRGINLLIRGNLLSTYLLNILVIVLYHLLLLL